MFLATLMAIPAMASKVVEDSKTRFILDDEVLDSEVYPCENEDGLPSGLNAGTFFPEYALYEDGNAVPFRSYRVALPSEAVPSVSVSDESLLPLGKSHCSEKDFQRPPLKFSAVTASRPFFKDGLWMVDVRVPLYVKNGGSLSLRKKFKLRVNIPAAPLGSNPGKRILDEVLNAKSAEKFGVSMNAARKALRKDAASQIEDVSFLAQFVVGDKNLATFSEDGLYAVDFKTIRTAMLSTMTQDSLSGIPVEKLCLYGASPDTLSDVVPGFAGKIPNHIFEIPIEVRDHSPNGSAADGTFDEGDSIVFVGYGNAFWKRADREDPTYVNGKMDYFHSYSTYSFFQNFLLGKKGSGNGLRLSSRVPEVSLPGKDVVWLRYVRSEKDAILRDTYFGKDLDWESSTGKEWFWAWSSPKDTTVITSSTLNSRETVNLPGFVQDGVNYAAVSYFPHRSVWDNTRYGGQSVDVSLSGKSYAERMKDILFVFHVNDVAKASPDLDVYPASDRGELMPGGNFRLDNVALRARDNQFSLTMIPNQFNYERFDGFSLAYQWKPVVDSAEWLLPGAVSGVINVPVPAGTDVMKFRNLRPEGWLQASGGVARDSIGESDDVRYLAVKKEVFRTGLKVEAIPPKVTGVISDLSRPNSKIEYLIVSPTEFLPAAVSLADFRSSDKATVTIPTAVVAVEDIYRRYTAGRVSPAAIRNYIAFVRDVCPNLKYVLLAGNGHFDYRGLNGKFGAVFIPPYEYEDKTTDDFYAALDSSEFVMYGTYDLDVSVGRLPVMSLTEFSNYVQKVMSYEKRGQMDFSEWRSSLLFASDDAWNSGHFDVSEHTLSMENFIRSIDRSSSDKGIRWNMKKVYLLNYDEDASGQKKEAAEDFMNVLNQGALFTTYFGHGSMTDWASEGLLKVSYLSRLNNKNHNTILGSFSCTVARFDFGAARSLSEEFVIAKDVGSIASVGATRETLGSLNKILAESYMLNGLAKGKTFLGDALRYGKAAGRASMSYSSQRYNDERYVLLGEPVISLPKFSHEISLDEKLDTLKALDKISLSGTVDGVRDGFLNLTISEGRSEQRISLQVKEDSLDVFYEGNMIFTEELPVKNGRFETEFITPRKLTFGDTAAEIRLWAYDNQSAAVSRYWRGDLKIVGVSSYADSLKDTIPPEIHIQPCFAGSTTDFANGGTIKLQSPACIQVVVEDSTALDFREQADEGISFEVVGVQDPFHPRPFLEQTSKRAKVRMNFAETRYPAGNYVFKVSALDVLGNRSVNVVNLEITDDLKNGLVDVFNAPNPVGKKGTTFYFKNLAFERMSKVDIFIYNQNGKLVKVIKNAVSGVTHWDGRDNHGRLLANGLYHYVVRSRVSSTKDAGKKTFTQKQKLLISR